VGDVVRPLPRVRPIYDKVSEAHPDVTFGKIDTDAEQDLAMTFEIRSIPTLMVFRDQVLVFARPGMIPAAALEDLVQKVKALDMDEVRRKVAADEAAHAEREAKEREAKENDAKAKAAQTG
jgi:thioredoxin 1